MACEGVHQPVLVDEVLRLLQPAGRSILLDCTVGVGGHAEAMLAAAGHGAVLIGIDLDEDNLKSARRRLRRFGDNVRLFHASFDLADEVLAEANVKAADLVLADLGFSSEQLAQADRGLSFSSDGPLDMRLDRSSGQTAAELVNGLPEAMLAKLIYDFGEERFSRRIARAIVRSRDGGRVERTVELARIVAGAIPAAARRSRRGVHPATRTFQALRIAVNDELGRLERLLAMSAKILAPGGRAGVISFHSLEDRRVKQAFARLGQTGGFNVLTKKPLTPSAQELARNPRSRSAKLRGLEKINRPAASADNPLAAQDIPSR